jgi:hypothetical protein
MKTIIHTTYFVKRLFLKIKKLFDESSSVFRKITPKRKSTNEKT